MFWECLTLGNVLGDIARAKGMSQIARETGLGRESLTKRSPRTAIPSSPRCSRSFARSASACTRRPMRNHGFVSWQARTGARIKSTSAVASAKFSAAR